MQSTRSFPWLFVLVLLVETVTFTVADSAATTITTGKNRYICSNDTPWLCRVRGGAKQNKDDEQQENSPRRGLWSSMNDLFQLNNQVKDEASTQEEEEEDEESVVYGRGGALVATSTKKQKQVGVASARLLLVEEAETVQEDNEQQQDDDVSTVEELVDSEEDAESEVTPLNMTNNAAKLWWFNEWWRFQMVTKFVQHGRKQEPDLLDDEEDDEDEWLDLEEEAPTERKQLPVSPYVSSGHWGTIDKIVSLGLSSNHERLRLSRRLRAVRKATAHMTGLHGLVSLKPSPEELESLQQQAEEENKELRLVQRRIAAIDRARQLVEERTAEQAELETAKNMTKLGTFFSRLHKGRRRELEKQLVQKRLAEKEKAAALAREAALKRIEAERLAAEQRARELEELKRRERVMEIDQLITRGQEEILELQCEKDELQRRPNPLYNYTTNENTERTTRQFKFPPENLVEEYLEEMFASGRLVRLNHTLLWKSGAGIDDEDDEDIGDDLLTPSGDAFKLYQEQQQNTRRSRRNRDRGNRDDRPPRRNGNGGGGSWLLRQSLGKGNSLGEKIGEAVETAGYKAVCGAVMSVLARSIAALHGINVMAHSDIRLFMEQQQQSGPDLPPVGKSLIPGSDDAENYAQAAIKNAVQKAKKKKRKSRAKLSEEAFLQREAVVETLISHCQISAPLLKLFPLAWQRGLLGNLITLIAAVVSDFADGIQLQILGHQLSLSFKPITESDMINHIGMGTYNVNHSRRARPEEFEAAVSATAEDVSEGLKFLDRWHERALGSGMLRAQIANLIARIVLTLCDEVLSGARMDLWSAQAGGPRMVAGLEYRTTTSSSSSPNPTVPNAP